LIKSIEEAIECYQAFLERRPVIRYYTVYVCYTGKEDLVKPPSVQNPPSRFLQLEFSKNTGEINSESIQEMLAPFGKCNKVSSLILRNCNI